ncbi:Lipase-like PAD4, partial [Mucuna pruriens]
GYIRIFKAINKLKLANSSSSIESSPIRVSARLQLKKERRKNHNSMRMAIKEASPFESREMLATFLSSTPLLSDSWRLCSQANATPFRSFVTERVGPAVYVAFSGVHMVGGSDPNWRNLVPLDSIGGVPLFPSRRSKEGEEPVMVPVGMLNLFFSLFNSFQNQMLEIVGDKDTKSVVITGHSIGGATASLCTLWLLSYLQSIFSSVSILCITYGAPLLGNESFSQTIFRERWDGNFYHVVSKHDIMPRLLFAPITSLTTQLNYLLQFWHLSMTSPDFGKLANQISEEEKAKLFTAVMDYLEAATKEGETSVPILLHPFGNYFFVSEEGAVCVDSPSAIIKMMHLMLATSSPASSIEDHLKYGDYVNKMSSQILYQSNSIQRNIPDSSYEAGLELAIQSSGIANQESAITSAKECLKRTRRMGPSPNLNVASLALSLSKVVPYRAQIEWYKTWCDEQDDQMGYYDSFKSRGSSSSKRDMKVNINRCKLARFWNNIIDMLERGELPHDFDKRAKVEEARDWLNCVRSERDTNTLALLWDKIENFEKYAINLIENKEVSIDVLFKNSSYSIWVEDLRELKQMKATMQRFPRQFTGFLDGEVVP